MKKVLCLIFALAMLCSAAIAEPAVTIRLEFEEGFALSLPEDWVSYAVDAESLENNILYCLGSADGTQLLYIQRYAVNYPDLDALGEALAALPGIELTGPYDYESASFYVYRTTDSDASGCITLLDGHVLNMLFTPRSNQDFMLAAATITESFAAID